MQATLKYLFIVCLILSGVVLPQETTSAAKAESPLVNPIKLQPISVPDELLNAGVAALGGQIFPASSQFQGKLPIPKEQLTDRLTGVFFTDPQIVFVIYKSSAQAKHYDRLIIDANANQLLEDEKVQNLSADNSDLPIKVFLGGRLEDFNFRTDTRNAWLIYPTIQSAMVDYNGSKVKAAVFSADKSYSIDNSIFFIDKNNNGRFDISRNPFEREFFFTSPLMSIGNKFYDLQFSADGKFMSFNQKTKLTGNINLALPQTNLPANMKYFFELLPEGGSSRNILFVYTNKLPLAIPNGTYSLLGAGVFSANNKELLTYAYPDFTVNNSSQIFDVDKLRIQIQVGQTPDGSIIKIGQKTLGVGKAIVNHVGDLDEHIGPEVIISKASEPDKEILKFNLEFG